MTHTTRKTYWDYLTMAITNKMNDHIDVIEVNSFNEGRKAGYDAGYEQAKREVKAELLAQLDYHNLNKLIPAESDDTELAGGAALGYGYAQSVLKGL